MPKPDLSGSWRFNREKSTLEIPAPDDSLLVIEHREPALRITRTHVARDERDTFSIDLTTDGREVLASHGELRLRARAYWDGDVLVFDTRIEKAGEAATNVVRYSPSPDGDTFRAEESLRSESMNYNNLWILDRNR